jgi:hypothetical protein
MRGMLEQDRADDMVTGVVRLFDGMVERHIEQLRDAFKKRARELYGRRSEQLSDAQLELLFELFQEQVEEASQGAKRGVPRGAPPRNRHRRRTRGGSVLYDLRRGARGRGS